MSSNEMFFLCEQCVDFTFLDINYKTIEEIFGQKTWLNMTEFKKSVNTRKEITIDNIISILKKSSLENNLKYTTAIAGSLGNALYLYKHLSSNSQPKMIGFFPLNNKKKNDSYFIKQIKKLNLEYLSLYDKNDKNPENIEAIAKIFCFVSSNGERYMVGGIEEINLRENDPNFQNILNKIPKLFSSAKTILVEGYFYALSPTIIDKIIEYAKNNKIYLIFSLSSVSIASLKNVAEHVKNGDFNLVIGNEEEIDSLVSTVRDMDICKCDMVKTLAENGAKYFTYNNKINKIEETHYEPACKNCECISTLGAGDAFLGGFMLGRDKYPLDKSKWLKLGNICAGKTIQVEEGCLCVENGVNLARKKILLEELKKEIAKA